MNMKTIIWPVVVAAAVGCGRAQDTQPPGPEWRATVRVVDEAGQRVSGADVTIGYYISPPANQSVALASKRGKTDPNGLFTASERSRSVDLLFGAVKEGYYKTHLDYELGAPYQYDRARWSPNLTMALKKIGSPIPMYAKYVNLGMPVF